jgi:hypothetical protein
MGGKTSLNKQNLCIVPFTNCSIGPRGQKKVNRRSKKQINNRLGQRATRKNAGKTLGHKEGFRLLFEDDTNCSLTLLGGLAGRLLGRADLQGILARRACGM